MNAAQRHRENKKKMPAICCSVNDMVVRGLAESIINFVRSSLQDLCLQSEPEHVGVNSTYFPGSIKPGDPGYSDCGCFFRNKIL